MTLPSSGPISLLQIAGEFRNNVNPRALLQYYRGGARVPINDSTGNIPASGAISLQDFYGAAQFVNALPNLGGVMGLSSSKTGAPPYGAQNTTFFSGHYYVNEYSNTGVESDFQVECTLRVGSSFEWLSTLDIQGIIRVSATPYLVSNVKIETKRTNTPYQDVTNGRKIIVETDNGQSFRTMRLRFRNSTNTANEGVPTDAASGSWDRIRVTISEPL